MAAVTVVLPPLLVGVAGCAREVPLAAATVAEALARLTELHPALKVHLFGETGHLRPHVLCFHNADDTRWRGDLAAPLADGDRVRILQAVSGG